MPTLYEITQEFQALEDILMENGGDVSDPKVEACIDEWMKELDKDLANKTEGYCKVILEMEARADAREKEAQRFAALVKVDRNAADRIKQRLKQHLLVLGQTKVQTPSFVVSVCNNGGKQPIWMDEANMPEEFLSWTPNVDGDKVRAALKEQDPLLLKDDKGELVKNSDDQPIEIARTAKRGNHLRIK